MFSFFCELCNKLYNYKSKEAVRSGKALHFNTLKHKNNVDNLNKVNTQKLINEISKKIEGLKLQIHRIHTLISNGRLPTK